MNYECKKDIAFLNINNKLAGKLYWIVSRNVELHVFNMFILIVLFIKVEWQKVHVWRKSPAVANTLQSGKRTLEMNGNFRSGCNAALPRRMVRETHALPCLLVLLQKHPTFQWNCTWEL